MNLFPINLDRNASYGLNPKIHEQLCRMTTDLLNPSSVHQGGQRSRFLLEQARDSIRNFLGMPRDATVVFTSGATESNNTSLFLPFWSYLQTNRGVDALTPELITTTVEHPAVIEMARKLSSMGVKVHYVYPREDRRFYAEDFASLVNSKTKLVSVMAVNNENGAILPVSEISDAVKSVNEKVLVHSDAVQIVGKKEFSFEDLKADFISISGHKVGALTGIGALVVKEGIGIDPLIVGGPQETRRRAGTENVLGAISFGLALDDLKPNLSTAIANNHKNKELLKTYIKKEYPQVQFLFEDIPNVGNTISVHFPKILNSDLVVALDLQQIYVSSGSACSSGKTLTSSAIMGFGYSDEVANETIRISLGGNYSEEQLQYAARAIAESAKKINRYV